MPYTSPLVLGQLFTLLPCSVSEVLHVLLDGGELLAAVLAEVPEPVARLPAQVTVLELAPATEDPVLVVGLGLSLWWNGIETME